VNLPGLCVFDGRAARSVVLWHLSEEQARAEGRPAGAVTAYALCGPCGEGFDAKRADAAERQVRAFKTWLKGRIN
jgi:hypothetical protein